MFAEIWTWITTNATTLGYVFGAGPTIWAIVQFILNKSAEAKRHQFESYHALIKQLVEQETPDQPMRLDRQIAVIFELRRFAHYRPVTLRIFKGLKQDWAGQAQPSRARLHEELDLAIEEIERKISCRLCRRR